MRAIKKGATDQSVAIRFVDSADGSPETGISHDTGGIALWYRRDGGAKTAITPAALSALTDAHTDGGLEHISDGYARIDLPDAAVASGANGVLVGGSATGMIAIAAYVHLVDYDPQDTVRLGLTALPNAAAAANGGLPTVNASNYVAGIQGTINTLDGLDTAQDSQHSTTQSSIAALNNLSSADAQTAANAAIVANGLDHLVAATVTGTDIVDNSIIARLVSKSATADWDSYAHTTDSLEALRDRGDAAWTTATGFSTLDAAGVRTAVGLASANLDTQLAALPTAAENADAVWEEAIADHSGTSGSTAEALNAAGSAGDPWTTTLPGSYTGSQAGKILADILTDTAEIGAAGAGLTEAGGTGDQFTAIPWNAAWDTEVESEVADALAVYDPPTNAEMEARTLLAAAYGTAANQATIIGYIDAEIAAILNAVDTEILAIKAVTDALPDAGALTTLVANVASILDDTGTAGVVVASGSKSGYALSSSGLDAILAESGISAGTGLTNDTGTQLTSINIRQAIAAILSAVAGALSGVDSNAPAFKPGGKPSGNTRISAATAATGRTSVTLKVPD